MIILRVFIEPLRWLGLGVFVGALFAGPPYFSGPANLLGSSLVVIGLALSFATGEWREIWLPGGGREEGTS